MRDTTAYHLSAKNLAARVLAGALFAGVALASPASVLAASPPGAAPSPGASQTRVLPWTGGEWLSVGLPADVDYVAGPNAGVAITGPADLIRGIVVDGGVIRNDETAPWRWFGWWGPRGWGDWDGNRIKIVVTAPRLSSAHVGGAGRLNLGRLAQDRLDLRVSGAGSASASGAIRSLTLEVSGSGSAKLAGLTTADIVANVSGAGRTTVAGTAETLRLHVSGAGHADMADLALQDVVAGLSGSGSAAMAPKRSADLGVSGAGNIRLLTSPARLATHRSGAGRISRPDGGDA